MRRQILSAALFLAALGSGILIGAAPATPGAPADPDATQTQPDFWQASIDPAPGTSLTQPATTRSAAAVLADSTRIKTPLANTVTFRSSRVVIYPTTPSKIVLTLDREGESCELRDLKTGAK